MRPLRVSFADDGGAPPAEDQLRRNLVALLKARRMRQSELAERMGRSQSWVSRRLSGKEWKDGGSRFQFGDLDRLSHIFGLSPAQLLQPGYGEWDRRSGHERRGGRDRRQPDRSGALHPDLRVRFPPTHRDDGDADDHFTDDDDGDEPTRTS